MERETLDGDDVKEIFHDVPKWEHAQDGSMRIQAPNGGAPSTEAVAFRATTEDGTTS